MKNPFWKIKSILILLLIPFSLFLILIPIILILFNEKGEYFLSLLFIPLGITLGTFSLKYVIKTDKSFKDNLIEQLNDHSTLIELLNYEKEEWQSFAKKYYQQKVKNYKIILLLLTPIFIFLMVVTYREDYRLSVAVFFSLFSIVIIAFIITREFLIDFKSKLFDVENPEAKITTLGILVNHNWVISYHNQDGWLAECKSSTFLKMKCLEFNIRRLGGRGHNYQTFFLLIPKNRENEIDEISSRINSRRVYKN